jgi:hypothetical protein
MVQLIHYPYTGSPNQDCPHVPFTHIVLLIFGRSQKQSAEFEQQCNYIELEEEDFHDAFGSQRLDVAWK